LFKRAVEADPFNAPSWQAYALFEKEQRQYDEARRLFKRAVEADPSHAPSWQAYALFEKEQRNFAEARRLLEEGLRRVRDGRGKGLLHSTLGGLLAGGGDLAAAGESLPQSAGIRRPRCLDALSFRHKGLAAHGSARGSLPSSVPRQGAAR
jgi:tetratricopeptide (TPR) repeat protein